MQLHGSPCRRNLQELISGASATVVIFLNTGCLTLSIKIAQKPYIIRSFGPEALKYESFEGKGYSLKLFQVYGVPRRPGPIMHLPVLLQGSTSQYP